MTEDASIEWSRPLSGASAGVNSAYWFACPLCGACVLDMEGSDANRRLHETFHNEGTPGGVIERIGDEQEGVTDG